MPYYDVYEQRDPNLPANRRFIRLPGLINGGIRYVKAAKPGFKWVINGETRKLNLVPINGRNLPIRQNYRIDDWADQYLNANVIKKVFPNMRNGSLKFSNLRPSLFGVKASFIKKLSREVFSDLAYNFARKKFANGITKVKVFGGRFQTIAEIKTRNQQLNLSKSMFKSVDKFPNRIDVTMEGFNVQIFPSSILINGGYKEPLNISVNRINGRKILGDGLDKLDYVINTFIPKEEKPIRDYEITNLNLDFSVNKKITDPFVATANGNELSKLVKDTISGNANIPKHMLDYVPKFYYEKGELNETSRFNLAELGELNKIPENIYIKFPKDKMNRNRKGGSYVSWKKGYIRIQGVNSLLKVLMLVRFVHLWYAIMARDNPLVLENKNIEVAKKKTAKKIVVNEKNVEKMGKVKLEVYTGRDGTQRLRINGKPCMDVSKKGYTSKEIKTFATKVGFYGADKAKREVLCQHMLELALNNKANRNRVEPSVRLGFKGNKLMVNGKDCKTYSKPDLVEHAKKLFIPGAERLTKVALCEKIERVAKNRNNPNVQKRMAKARGVIRRAVAKKAPAIRERKMKMAAARSVLRRGISRKRQDKLLAEMDAEMERELEREFGSLS